MLHLTCFTLRDEMEPTISKYWLYKIYLWAHERAFWIWRCHGHTYRFAGCCAKNQPVCHAMPSHQTTIFGFCCVFPYLALIMVMEKNFSALLDFALLRFSTELYFMVKSRRREKLLIKALRMCVRMRNKKYVKTHAHTHSRRAIAMCYHIDLMKFYYLGPQLVDEITVFFVHPS